MIDIVAVGEIVIDFSPIPNAENGNLRYEAQPGGAPSNLLAEASLLGASTRLLGAVGNDPLGEFLCKIAERYGFGGDGVKKVEALPTPFTLVSFDALGDRSFHSVQTETSLQAFQTEMLDEDILQQADRNPRDRADAEGREQRRQFGKVHLDKAGNQHRQREVQHH